nr:MAG TPA: hypothetical protein [Caudoviricetes sp.]
MGFIKKIWKDRISEFPTRRSLTKTDGTSELVSVARSEGMISEEGDAFSAENMNDFENRVANGFSELTEKIPNPVLLWENPNPTQRFPVDGTIELSSDDYNWLEIYYYSNTTSNGLLYQKVKKGDIPILIHTHFTSSGSGFGYRALQYVDDTHLKGTGYSIRQYFSNNVTPQFDNKATAYGIPVKIYGIK